MQILIDISEEMYNFACNYPEKVLAGYSLCIKNGTVLPKGHGRLGDLDKIWNKLKELEEYYQAEFLKESNAIHESAMSGRLYGFTNSKFIVQDAETIIESDKE